MFMADWLVNGFNIDHKWRQYIQPGEQARGDLQESWCLIGWWRQARRRPRETLKPSQHSWSRNVCFIKGLMERLVLTEHIKHIYSTHVARTVILNGVRTLDVVCTSRQTEARGKPRWCEHTKQRNISPLTVSGPQATVCSGEDDPLVGALCTHTHIHTHSKIHTEYTTDLKILT